MHNHVNGQVSVATSRCRGFPLVSIRLRTRFGMVGLQSELDGIGVFDVMRAVLTRQPRLRDVLVPVFRVF